MSFSRVAAWQALAGTNAPPSSPTGSPTGSPSVFLFFSPLGAPGVCKGRGSLLLRGPYFRRSAEISSCPWVPTAAALSTQPLSHSVRRQRVFLKVGHVSVWHLRATPMCGTSFCIRLYRAISAVNRPALPDVGARVCAHTSLTGKTRVPWSGV